MLRMGITDLLKSNNRETNFELLRLLAVLMILVLHVNRQFGENPVSYIENHPVDAFFQNFLNIASIVGVNVFVLISGWFGIKPSVKGFVNLIFQIVFITSFSWLVVKIFGLDEKHFRPFYAVIWFVYSYLLLYILSPLLNCYIKHSEKKEYRILLITFFVFMTLFGWVIPLNGGFDDGYSTLSFMFLYLLSRYLRMYYPDILDKKLGGAFSYLLITLMETVAVIWFYANDYHAHALRLKIVSYINPLVIFNSVLLLILFANMKLKQSKCINYISSSSFAIILFHTSPFVIEPTYYGISKVIFVNFYGGDYWWRIVCFVMIFFVGGFVIDQIRKICWNYVLKITNTLLIKRCFLIL